MKGKQRLINMKQRSRPRHRNPFIIDEANENNKYFNEYYNKGLYSPKSDSDSDGKVKRNWIVSSDSEESFDGSMNVSGMTDVVEGIVGEIDTSELVALDNMNVSDEIQKRYENSMNGTMKSLINSPKIFENLKNAGSYKKLEECVSHGRGRGQGKAGGRRRPLVSTPITEDWRSKTKSIEGVQTKNRCINYKEV